MRNRYDKKTIKKACTLYEKGVPLRAIMEKTGIKSSSTIQFACDPEYREKHNARSLEWRKKNPARWKEINTKAVQNYQKKKDDSHGKK
jgi:hypothetical protein